MRNGERCMEAVSPDAGWQSSFIDHSLFIIHRRRLCMLSEIKRRLHEGVNYRLRTLGGGRFASHVRPVCPLILLTELCNARCVHCDIWKNRGKEDSPSV